MCNCPCYVRTSSRESYHCYGRTVKQLDLSADRACQHTGLKYVQWAPRWAEIGATRVGRLWNQALILRFASIVILFYTKHLINKLKI